MRRTLVSGVLCALAAACGYASNDSNGHAAPTPTKAEARTAQSSSPALEVDTARFAPKMASGRFTLRLDTKLTCLYLEGDAGTRIKPVFVLGTVVRHGPLRVVRPGGATLIVVDKSATLGGGFVGTARDGDPFGCGATQTWEAD
jgi:hypothetical protein